LFLELWNIYYAQSKCSGNRSLGTTFIITTCREVCDCGTNFFWGSTNQSLWVKIKICRGEIVPGPLVANAEPGAVLLQREVDDFAAACAEAEASINRFFLM